MQLCLVNNDPTSTILITPDGIPLFSIETKVLHVTATQVQAPVASQKSPTTMIKRLERYSQSTGHVETAIGVVEYRGPAAGTHLQLLADNHELQIASLKTAQIADRPEEEDTEKVENSWEFTGPDEKRYKWQIFLHSPIVCFTASNIYFSYFVQLMIADTTFTPLARYRRAKLGIVSRSRRAFLEILPAGLELLDLIVVTFVAFMKQRLIIDGGPSAIYQYTAHGSPNTASPSPSNSPSSGLESRSAEAPVDLAQAFARLK
ncbi:hypothetical protein B0H34DRAFT_744127 [Crassisporium funariophilum]|nr:hypothetical protein B0H34DRAFT_744127 [Crassisporium funariophilum]